MDTKAEADKARMKEENDKLQGHLIEADKARMKEENDKLQEHLIEADKARMKEEDDKLQEQMRRENELQEKKKEEEKKQIQIQEILALEKQSCQQTKPAEFKEVFLELKEEKVIVGAFLEIPSEAKLIVVFAHGSGSSRHSSRIQLVAKQFMKEGIAILILDMLLPEENQKILETKEFRESVPMLGRRLVSAVKTLKAREDTKSLKLGFFGDSTGATATLIAAAELGNDVTAVVSKGARPDWAVEALDKVNAPTLLIIGGNDDEVLEHNLKEYVKFQSKKRMDIIPEAKHIFKVPQWNEVARISAAWFKEYSP
jgi:putative phosphoribosyl transferase